MWGSSRAHALAGRYRMQPGYWWRWSRQGMTEAEREEADAAWIDLYGRHTYDLMLASTEWVLELPYPPSDEPVHLSYHAASGEPNVWPAHEVSRGTHATSLAHMHNRLNAPALPVAPTTGRADQRETPASPPRRRIPLDPRAGGIPAEARPAAGDQERARLRSPQRPPLILRPREPRQPLVLRSAGAAPVPPAAVRGCSGAAWAVQVPRRWMRT